jgi:hypothetical protein
MASHLSCGLDCRRWSPPSPPQQYLPRSNIFPTTNLPEYPESSHNPHCAITTTGVSFTLTISLAHNWSILYSHIPLLPSQLPSSHPPNPWMDQVQYTKPCPPHLTTLTALSPQLESPIFSPYPPLAFSAPFVTITLTHGTGLTKVYHTLPTL